jgi:hypothetical protein
MFHCHTRKEREKLKSEMVFTSVASALEKKISIAFPQEGMRGRGYDFGRFGALSEYQIFFEGEMREWVSFRWLWW